MKIDPTTHARFRELLGLLIDEEISEAEIRELTEIVKTNEACSCELRDQLLMDERLAQSENEFREANRFSLAVEAALEAEMDGDSFVEKAVNFVDSKTSQTAPGKGPWLLAGISFAACLALAFVMLQGDENAINDDLEPSLAIIETLVGEVKIDDLSRIEGDSLSAGILEVDGYVALEFYKGARMNVAGPARLELVDSQRVICHSGKIWTTVPPLAKGFTVVTSESEVVDLGTEFAMEVDPKGTTAIHVFDGAVEAYNVKREPRSMQLLKAGHAMKISGADNREPIPADTQLFSDLFSIKGLSVAAETEKMEAWKKVNAAALSDIRLLAYYDFEPEPRARRTLVNRALTGKIHDGAIIGARWKTGPWQGKKALDFKHPGDRVRINLTGDCESITLATWIRVDGLDRSHSSILLADGFEPGEIHWQFRKGGDLLAGLHFSDSRKANFSQPGFMDLNRLGRWFHLATVIDRTNQTATHYLDGELFATRELRVNGEWNFGYASIGNWSGPKDNPATVRSLNGAIAELMIFKAPLEPEEIRRLALHSGN